MDLTSGQRSHKACQQSQPPGIVTYASAKMDKLVDCLGGRAPAMWGWGVVRSSHMKNVTLPCRWGKMAIARTNDILPSQQPNGDLLWASVICTSVLCCHSYCSHLPLMALWGLIWAYTWKATSAFLRIPPIRARRGRSDSWKVFVDSYVMPPWCTMCISSIVSVNRPPLAWSVRDWADLIPMVT